MADNSSATFIFRIYRGTSERRYWEEFELPRKPFQNVTAALMEIQQHPVNLQGERVAPVVWEQGCLEEVCGSCSMLINGYPRQACTALIDTIIAETGSTTITLAPFSKFPLVRDLIVNRDSMFENLKKVHAWVEADGSYDRGFGPRISQHVQEVMYTLSTCMTCGCCVEACPQVNERSSFMGAQIISQVRLFNDHPIGTQQRAKRLHAMMGDGGVAGCGKAKNCSRVCPKRIPLVESIAAVARDVNIQALKELFSLPDRS
jgi:succinate dehydrogenase / fumarate reductase iron-sulfur subunit